MTEGRAPSGGMKGICSHVSRRAVLTFSAIHKLVVSNSPPPPFFFLFCGLKPLCGFPYLPDALVSPQLLRPPLAEMLKLTNLASSGLFLEFPQFLTLGRSVIQLQRELPEDSSAKA